MGALVLALYPRYPTDAGDNRAHLQLFRHLVVLAAEPRLLLPVDQGRILPAKLKLTYKACPSYEACSVELEAPLLLPELAHLAEVCLPCVRTTACHSFAKVAVVDDRYWPRVFRAEVAEEWAELERILAKDGHLSLLRRAGCCDRLEDPSGSKNKWSGVRLGDRDQFAVPLPSGPDQDTLAAAVADWAARLELPQLAEPLKRLCEVPTILPDSTSSSSSSSHPRILLEVCTGVDGGRRPGDVRDLGWALAFGDKLDALLPDSSGIS